MSESQHYPINIICLAILALCIMALLLSSCSEEEQTQYGSITGSIILSDDGDTEIEIKLVQDNAIIKSDKVILMDGSFFVTDIIPGKYGIILSSKDYQDKAIEYIEIFADKTTDIGIVYLEKAEFIIGINVYDRKTGNPIPEAMVSVLTQMGEIIGLTDEFGGYEYKAAKGMDLEIRIGKDGYKTETIMAKSVDIAGDLIYDIRLFHYGIEIGDMALDFTLPSLDGDEITLSNMNAKAIVLDFTATWCKPCREEMPHLVDLQEKYYNDGLVILAIDVGEDADKVRKGWQDIPLKRVKMLIDDDFEVAVMYRFPKVLELPKLWLLDKENVITWIHEGFVSGDELTLEEQIKKVLGIDE